MQGARIKRFGQTCCMTLERVLFFTRCTHRYRTFPRQHNHWQGGKVGMRLRCLYKRPVTPLGSVDIERSAQLRGSADAPDLAAYRIVRDGHHPVWTVGEFPGLPEGSWSDAFRTDPPGT